MTERLHGDEVSLEVIGNEIDALLADVKPVSDGTNLNTFDSKLESSTGAEIDISKSQRPGGKIYYHIRQENPVDEKGFYESWDYCWSKEQDLQVIHLRRENQHRFSSMVHDTDEREEFFHSNVDVGHMQELVERYARI